MRKELKQKIYIVLLFFAPFSLMAATDFKQALGRVMGFGAIIAFCLCVFFSYEGIMHWRQGGNFGRDIIGVVLTAGAIAICTYIFVAFGMGDAALTPQF